MAIIWAYTFVKLAAILSLQAFGAQALVVVHQIDALQRLVQARIAGAVIYVRLTVLACGNERKWE